MPVDTRAQRLVRPRYEAGPIASSAGRVTWSPDGSRGPRSWSPRMSSGSTTCSLLVARNRTRFRCGAGVRADLAPRPVRAVAQCLPRRRPGV